MRSEDALIVMAWLATHPKSDANALGRLVTNGGTPRQVSSVGQRIAADLRRFGYVKAARDEGCRYNRLCYTLTPAGRRALKG